MCVCAAWAFMRMHNVDFQVMSIGSISGARSRILLADVKYEYRMAPLRWMLIYIVPCGAAHATLSRSRLYVDLYSRARSHISHSHNILDNIDIPT